MKNFPLWAIIGFLVLTASPAHAGPLDDLLRKMQQPPSETAGGRHLQDQKTTVSGLKEALSIGAENAVRSVSKVDGYFGNELIRIFLPATNPFLQKEAATIFLPMQIKAVLGFVLFWTIILQVILVMPLHQPVIV